MPPKIHHYVPQFYLARFVDDDGHLWVYDKHIDNVFCSSPRNIGCEKGFYTLPELLDIGANVTHLESQFSEIEGEASRIIACWLTQLEQHDRVMIPEVNREIMSQFLVLQLLRTAEAREQLLQFAEGLAQETIAFLPEQDPRADATSLHAHLLWDEELIASMSERVKGMIWVFARNHTTTSFCTSDHPVLIKSKDSKDWLMGARVFDAGVYLVYPLTPEWILYCKDPSHWTNLLPFDCRVSPVQFTMYMAEHENSGQIGMSRRFVYGNSADFSFTRMFLNLHPESREPNRERYEYRDDDDG